VKIYSIVITYNGEQWVDKCFKSLVNSNIVNHHMLAIDNGSTDNTLQLIRQNYPTVEIIETGQNLGFGKANNIGMRKAIGANADYVFLLNQDAWVQENTISQLVAFAEKHPEYSILSPMQYYNDTILDFKFAKYYKRGKLNENGIVDVGFVNAAIWLIRTSDLKHYGLFHESFSHYGEDAEICQRIILNKGKIGIVDNIKGFHEREQLDKKPNKTEKIKRAEINILLKLAYINEKPLIGLLKLSKYLLSNYGKYDFNRFSFFKKFKVLSYCIPLYLRTKNLAKRTII